MVLVAAGAALLLIALIGFGAHFYTAQRDWTLGIVAIAPLLMLGVIPGAALMAATRQWIGLGVALLVLGLCVSTQSRLYIASPAPARGQRIVVMTANLRLGEGSAADVVSAVRRHHVDLLMLEELTPDERERLRVAGLDDVLRHAAAEPRVGAEGTGLWSRYPLTDVTYPDQFVFAMVIARVEIPGRARPISAVALHMSGPVPVSFGWAHDIATLPAVLDALPTDAPVVVGGDFNATNDTSQFRNLLTHGYRDAADQAGAGITFTWPSDRWYPPLIAIDHVLTRDAVGTSATTVDIPGSDHRALVSTVVLA